MLILPGLIYSYTQLVHLLKNFHPLRFKEVRTQIRFFFWTETIPLLIDFVMKVMFVLNGVNKNIISDELVAILNIVDGILLNIYPFV